MGKACAKQRRAWITRVQWHIVMASIGLSALNPGEFDERWVAGSRFFARDHAMPMFIVGILAVTSEPLSVSL